MRVLYKDFSDGYLSVAEVTGTTYYEEEQVLEFIGSDRDFVRIGEERVESRAHGEIHRQGVFRIAEIPAQIAQLGACAQRRVAADVLQRPLPRGAQIHGQRVG